MRRRWLRYSLIALVLVGAMAASAVVVFQSDWLRERLRRAAVTQASKFLLADVTIGRLSGSLWHGVVLDDVTLRQDGDVFFHANRVAVVYDAMTLIHGHLVLDELTVDQPSVRIAEDERGWNTNRLLRPRDAKGKPFKLDIKMLHVIGGRVDVLPRRITARHLTAMNLVTHVTIAGKDIAADISQAAFHDEPSGFDVRQLTGRSENGLKMLSVSFDADRQNSRLSGKVSTTRSETGRHVDADVNAVGVDLEPILGGANWQSDLTLRTTLSADVPDQGPAVLTFHTAGPHARAYGYEGADVDAKGMWARGRLDFNAHASGYGARGTIAAQWQITSVAGAQPHFDGNGDFAGVDLRQLPKLVGVPPLQSRLAGTYRVHQDAAGWRASTVLRASTVEGAALESGTKGSFERRGRVTYYSSTGVAHDVDLQRIAGPLRLPSLAADRYESRLGGPFSITGREGCPTCGVDREITAQADLVASKLADTTLDGVSASMTLQGSRLSIAAKGPVTHLTARTLGLASPTMDLNGTVDGNMVIPDLRVPFTVRTLTASGTIDLTASAMNGARVDRVHVDGHMEDGLATIATADVDGYGTHASGKGVLALGEAGESAFDLQADSDDLAAIGATLGGRPLAGAGHLEAHVVGPHDKPRATGKLLARQVAIGTDFTALTFNHMFDAAMPDWAVANLTASVTSEAAFLTIRGVEIVRASSRGTYREGQLDADVDLADRDREVKLAGRLAYSANTRTLSASTLSIKTGNQTWALPAGSQAIFRDDGRHLDVEGLTLAQGAERIDVSGQFALTQEAAAQAPGLRVTLSQIQLADANRIILGTRKLTGLVDGSVEIAGTIDEPRLKGEITIAKGTVETTPFDSLTAHATLASHELTIDGTIVQSGANALNVTGHMPLGVGQSQSPAPMAVHVTSTNIDLGLAQLLTSRVTQPSGTGELNLDITGSPQKPIVNGTVRLNEAAFTLVSTNVRYHAINAGMLFTDNHLKLDGLTLSDPDNDTLTASGTVDVLGDSPAFDVTIKGRSVRVLNNELGTVQINADLSLKGDFAAPVITGQLRVDSGRLQVDRILERTTKGAYSALPEAPLPNLQTPPPATDPNAPAPAGPTPPARPLFDRVQVDVVLDLPDNLLLRGRDIRVGAAGSGLGDINVVAGGRLRVRKPAGGALDVLGDVQVIRGTYSFQGRRFDVQRDSEVRFRGEPPSNPALDVTATRDVTGITTMVHVRGTAQRPDVQLSSNPPLDQADILSLIVFGQSLNDLGDAQRNNLAERAGYLAAGTVATPIADSVARALNLDVFEVLAPNDTVKAPQVSVGTQIGSHVYVGVKREIGGGEHTSLSFEYRFTRLIRLVTSFAEGALQEHALTRAESSGIDLLFVFRF